MLSVEEKIEHLKQLGIEGDMTQVKKMYSGDWFKLKDYAYQQLIYMSKKLCEEYNMLSSELNNPNKNVLKFVKNRQQHILDDLFPGHGVLLGCLDGLEVVIGCVDIGGFNYINVRNKFNKTALVTLDEYVVVAPNNQFGQSELTVVDGMAKLEKIHIKDNTWICANCKFLGDVTIAAKSVIGLGSVVNNQSKIAENSLAFGNPCNSYKVIDDNYVAKKELVKRERSKDEIQHLIAHAKKLGFDGDFEQYIRMLNCERYNALDDVMAGISNLSHNLCSHYNETNTSQLTKHKILERLFPLCGKNLKVGEDLFVDVLGATKIGDDVSIGDGVTLAGNVTIGNNVKMGKNLVVQCIGHSVNYKERQLKQTTTGGLSKIAVSGFIDIADNLNLADGTKILPNVVLTRDTNPDEIVLK